MFDKGVEFRIVLSMQVYADDRREFRFDRTSNRERFAIRAGRNPAACRSSFQASKKHRSNGKQVKFLDSPVFSAIAHPSRRLGYSTESRRMRTTCAHRNDYPADGGNARYSGIFVPAFARRRERSGRTFAAERPATRVAAFTRKFFDKARIP
jgi:hypothetical protein